LLRQLGVPGHGVPAAAGVGHALLVGGGLGGLLLGPAALPAGAAGLAAVQLLLRHILAPGAVALEAHLGHLAGRAVGCVHDAGGVVPPGHRTGAQALGAVLPDVLGRVGLGCSGLTGAVAGVGGHGVLLGVGGADVNTLPRNV